ncbi:MAG TPA: Stp1/IreP family PP2C-type Ser/Thr phosphatase [Gemmatimonadaceae bacterium]|nr:Stp1/IreP family PP2C-type Ser/Thr phosphatase [Gemmatimonadaceae bacterium]
MPAAPRGQILVHVFGRTDVGLTREHNEDTFLVADLSTGNATLQPEVRTHSLGERGSVFMVADGMGGAASGEIASAMAVDTVLEELKRRWITVAAADPQTFAVALRMATEAANSAIHRYSSEHPENRGMGTTATLAGMLGDVLYIAQVGDSRAYIVRDGVCRQITKDQSLMQKLLEAGEITAEEAEQSDRKNIILQALGPEPRIRIDLTHQQVRRGDTLILCSDGLSGQVRPEQIGQVVREESDLMAVCRRLIELANEAGGPDNITVVAVRFEGPGLLPPGNGDDVGHRVYPLAGSETPTIPMERYEDRPETPTEPRPRLVDSAPTRAATLRGRLLLLGIAAVLLLLLGALVTRPMWRGSDPVSDTAPRDAAPPQ